MSESLHPRRRLETELDDDVVDVTSSLALDVVETHHCIHVVVTFILQCCFWKYLWTTLRNIVGILEIWNIAKQTATSSMVVFDMVDARHRWIVVVVLHERQETCSMSRTTIVVVVVDVVVVVVVVVVVIVFVFVVV